MRFGDDVRHLDLDGVLGVERQERRDREPAARAERQAVDALILRQLLGELMDVDHDRRPQVAHGEPRDLLGRRDVALHDDGRDEQQIGDVVEAARRVIGGQQQLEIELARQVVEREQVADGVAVLGARQPPERRHLAGVRPRRRGLVERAFEIGRCAADTRHDRGADHRAASTLRAACGRSFPNAPALPQSLRFWRGR